MLGNMKMKEFILPLGLLIVVFFAPYVFTRSFGCYQFNESTGAIGDTIGGITAPICSLIGSILVYLALKAQIDANKLINIQFEYQKLNSFITDQVNLIRSDIDSFTAIRTTKNWDTNGRLVAEKEYLTGKDAIHFILYLYSEYKFDGSEIDYLEKNIDLHQIDLFLKRIVYLFEKIESSKLDKSDADYLYSIFSYTYESKLKSVLKLYESNRASKSITHYDQSNIVVGLPELIYMKYDHLNQIYRH